MMLASPELQTPVQLFWGQVPKTTAAAKREFRETTESGGRCSRNANASGQMPKQSKKVRFWIGEWTVTNPSTYSLWGDHGVYRTRKQTAKVQTNRSPHCTVLRTGSSSSSTNKTA